MVENATPCVRMFCNPKHAYFIMTNKVLKWYMVSVIAKCECTLLREDSTPLQIT